MLRSRISARGRCLVGAGVVLVAGGAPFFAGSAFAQSPIGSATTIQNRVLGHTGGEIFAIHRGDGVFLDQLVQTQNNSKAKFVFLDLTNMSVGPDSIVKLDEFVYSGAGRAKTVTINATKGAFRFFSGNSEHNAYKVTTPQAVIGVRGTTYDVRIGNGQTYIKLQDGAVTACVRSGAVCRDLDRPGESLIVNDSSIEGPFPPSNSGWDFGDLCGGGANDLCNKTTRFAFNNPPPPPPSGGNAAPPRGPAHPGPGRGPGLTPPVRAAGLPPPVGTAPPVYVPPRVQPLPPVVIVDPPVYVPPHRPPVRPWPPHRPPHRPPVGEPPVKPPVEGKPRPGADGRPPVILGQAAGKYRPWPGRGATRTDIGRIGPRGTRIGDVRKGPRSVRVPQSSGRSEVGPGPRYVTPRSYVMPRRHAAPRSMQPAVRYGAGSITRPGMRSAMAPVTRSVPRYRKGLRYGGGFHRGGLHLGGLR